MHKPNHFTNPPPRRIGCLALIQDGSGNVLLVEKKYKKDQGDPFPWGLPGGCAESDEDPFDAARREVHEELGLHIDLGDVLTVHYMPRNGDSLEGINLVYSGGTISPDTPIRLPDELSDYRFFARSELSAHAAPYTVARIEAAFASLPYGGAAYRSGHPETTG